MVEAISNTLVGQNIHAMDRIPQEKLYSPGLYSIHQMTAPPPYKEKDGGFLGFLGKLVLTAAIICGGAVLAKKTALKSFDVEKVTKESGKLDKIKKFIYNFGDKVEEKAKKIIDSVKKSKKSDDAKPPKADTPASEGE